MGKRTSQLIEVAYLDTTQSPDAYVDIDHIVSFTGPGGPSGELDVTTLQSTAREFIAGLQDPGSFSMEIMFDIENTSHQWLIEKQKERSTETFQITYPADVNDPGSGEETVTFDAYVSEFTTTGGVDTPVSASVSLRVTGDITYSFEA